MLRIRKADKSDFETVWNLYLGAQDFMARTGNPNQWSNTYPPRDMIEEDLTDSGTSYVVYDEQGIHGVFVLLFGEDTCYKVIENGEWKNNEPYVTIHRIASDFKVKGILKAAVEFALAFENNVRIDTHQDNVVMQKAVTKCGFEKCGTIYVRDHSPRIAYQLTKRTNDSLSSQNDKIKVVFIDIDNTLLSFEEYVKWAMKHGFERFGFVAYEPYMYDVFQKINTGFWLRHERGEITFDHIQNERWGKVFEALGIDDDGHAFEEYFRTQIFDNAILEPHAEEMLEYLHGKYVLATASNGPYEQQKHRLAVGGIDKYFDFVFISEDIGVQKPEKEFFSRCFDRMKSAGVYCKPEEAIIIGDSLTSDMAGGINAGMHTCYFTRGQQIDNKPSGVEHVVRTLDEIKNIL